MLFCLIIVPVLPPPPCVILHHRLARSHFPHCPADAFYNERTKKKRRANKSRARGKRTRSGPARFSSSQDNCRRRSNQSNRSVGRAGRSFVFVIWWCRIKSSSTERPLVFCFGYRPAKSTHAECCRLTKKPRTATWDRTAHQYILVLS